jgi:hypothetical protein
VPLALVWLANQHPVWALAAEPRHWPHPATTPVLVRQAHPRWPSPWQVGARRWRQSVLPPALVWQGLPPVLRQAAQVLARWPVQSLPSVAQVQQPVLVALPVVVLPELSVPRQEQRLQEARQRLRVAGLPP